MNERPSPRRLLLPPRSALTHLATINTPRTWEMGKRERGAVWARAVWWYGNHLRGLDFKIKEVGGGLPHLIPYPYISLLGNPALQHLGWLLIASRFSKGHSISRGSIPRLCLILFCTVVAAQKLIKEHLISITCCQWMLLNGVTVYRSWPFTHTQVVVKRLFLSWSSCWCSSSPWRLPSGTTNCTNCGFEVRLFPSTPLLWLKACVFLTFSSFALISHLIKAAALEQPIEMPASSSAKLAI